jgi:hypothetical protein
MDWFLDIAMLIDQSNVTMQVISSGARREAYC